MQGTVITSPDGTTWASRSSGDSEQLNGVAFGGGLFVAVGNNRTILTSADGVGWTQQTDLPGDIGSRLNKVAYTGSQFVVAADANGVLTSADGVTWNRQSVSPFPNPELRDV